MPLAFAQGLVNIAGYKIVQTPFTSEKFYTMGLLGHQPLAFNPERDEGTFTAHLPGSQSLVHAQEYVCARATLPSLQTEWMAN